MKNMEMNGTEAEEKKVFKSQRSPARGNKTMFFFLLYVITVIIVMTAVMLIRGLHIESLFSIALTQIICVFIPFLFYLLFTRQKPNAVLNLAPIGIENTVLVIALTLAFTPFVHFISRLSAFVFFPITISLEGYSIWLVLLVVAVFPSVFEEIFMRGALYSEFERLPIKKIALITGLFFGIMHLNFHQAIYTGILGILWAYARYYTRTVLAPVLMHFIHNGLFILLSFSETYMSWYLELWETPLMFLLIHGFLSAVLFPVFFICFKKLKANSAVPQENTDTADGALPQENTDTTDTEEEEKPKTFTWAFWAVLVLFLLFSGLVEAGMRYL